MLTVVTPTQQLVELSLGGTVKEFIATRRDQGASWRGIAAEIHNRTGISVSYETVRSWHSSNEAAA